MEQIVESSSTANGHRGAAAKVHGKSSISNGKTLLPTASGCSVWARIMKDTLGSLVAHCGGVDVLSGDHVCRELKAPKDMRPPGDRRQFGSMALNNVMEEAETAFDHQDYDKAEHLIKVATFMAHREIARFKADPKRWIDRRQELDA